MPLKTIYTYAASKTHHTGTKTRGSRSIQLAASRLTSFMVSTALVLGQIFYPVTAFATEDAQTWLRSPSDFPLPAVEHGTPLDPEDMMIASFENLFAMLEDYQTSFPTLDGLATRFGNDPEAAFVFVRDTMRTEPYVGTLRNPMSVIAASGGNTQDKSELLMTLLRKMGHDARIAEAPLTDAIRARIRAASCEIVPSSEEHIDKLIGLHPTATARAVARAQRDYARLLDAVPAITDAVPVLSMQMGDRHYWVQYRDGAGWRDFDTALPDMQAGEAMASPDALSEGGGNPHQITISVVVETLHEGNLREQTVLTHELNARDSDEAMIQLGFISDTIGFTGILVDKLADAIDLSPRIKPVLIVDFIPQIGNGFAQPGPLNVGGLTETSQEDAVTAVWLDLTSVAPQGVTRTARRAAIDLLAFESRQSDTISNDDILSPAMGTRYPSALEGVNQIVVTNGGLDARNYAYRVAYILKNLDKLIDGTFDPEVLSWVTWSTAHGLATGAERATRDLRSQDGESCGFSGHANIMISSLIATGPETYTSSLDWAIDGIDLASSETTPDPRELQAMRLWYGAVRSAIETEAISAGGTGAITSDAGQIISTSVLLDGPLQRLTPAEIVAMKSTFAKNDYDDGYLLLSAASSEAPAWWRVDPATGAADARMGDLGNFSFFWGPNYTNTALRGIGTHAIAEMEMKIIDAKIRGILTKQQERAAYKLLEFHRNRAIAAARGGNEYLTTQNIVLGIGYVAVAALGIYTFVKFAQAYGYRG